MTDRDKYSSLLWYENNYDRKKFYKIGPRQHKLSQIWKEKKKKNIARLKSKFGNYLGGNSTLKLCHVVKKRYFKTFETIFVSISRLILAHELALSSQAALQQTPRH